MVRKLGVDVLCLFPATSQPCSVRGRQRSSSQVSESGPRKAPLWTLTHWAGTTNPDQSEDGGSGGGSRLLHGDLTLQVGPGSPGQPPCGPHPPSCLAGELRASPLWASLRPCCQCLGFQGVWRSPRLPRAVKVVPESCSSRALA